MKTSSDKETGRSKKTWREYQAYSWEKADIRQTQFFWDMLTFAKTNPNSKALIDIIIRIARNQEWMQDSSIRNRVGDILTCVKEGKDIFTQPEYITSNIKLSIGILVSNNIGTIRKCLDSLASLRTAVKSELIVVDTKGEETDGSMEIAREYADKVYSFTWCNDFAAARNVCMEHAEGEWFLFVDDDEWFENTDEIIEFFCSGESDKYGHGLYYIHNYYDEKGNYAESIAGRFIRRTANTRFVGRVHECFNEIHPPAKFFKSYAHHSGYNYKNETEKIKHQERNLTLLRAQLVEEGYTASVCAQIVQELFQRRDTWEEAFWFCKECLPILLEQPNAMQNSFVQWILVCIPRYYDCIANYESFWNSTNYLKQNFDLSQLAELFISVMEVRNAMKQGAVEICEKSVERFLELWDWLDKHPEEAVAQNQLDFGTYYNEDTYAKVMQTGAMCANKKQNQKPIKLTIGMLVSNHINYIRKAMEALKPLLEAVPSELIVLDTKGADTDGSIEIVREYTDKIYPFTWCNDFSAARNECLKHAQGEWFLYQDDDEWFDNVQEFIEFFQSGECEKYNAGNYYTRDYLSDGTYSMSVAGRMIRRTETTRFEGRIHETFNAVLPPVKQFSCFTHHYGYVYQTEAEAKAKFQRNISILKKELVEHGTVPRLCAQMVQELFAFPGTAESGLAFALDALKRFEASGEEFLTRASAQWIMLAIVRYYAGKKDLEEAEKQLNWLKGKYDLNGITHLCLAGCMANLARDVGAMDVARKYAKNYLEYWNWKQTQPEEVWISMVNFDMPKYYTEDFYQQMSSLALQEPMLIRSDIKLTIGMLVSNHIQYIRNVMESLKPLLEAVSSELIVVDTKGAETDGSIEIVREYTDKIYPFTWCNDFSAARNVCMEHARGEWFLYLDDDEWFDDVQEFIEFFNSEESEKYQFGYYYTRDYFINGTYSVGLAGRVIRRRENTRFVGKIHETFNQCYTPQKYFSCFTHHQGYVYETKEAKAAKHKRNIDILEQEIRENGMDLRNAVQMVQELLGQEETAKEGYELAMDCVSELNSKGVLGNSASQWLLAATVRYFSLWGEYSSLCQQVQRIEKYAMSEITEMVVSATVLFEAFDEKDYAVVLRYADKYLKNWDWRLSHPEEAMAQVALDFALYCTDDYYHRVLYYAAVSANHLEDYEQANTYWKRMPWQQLGMDAGEYKEELYNTIAGLKEANESRKQEKLAGFASMAEVLLEAGTQVKSDIAQGNMNVAKQYLVAMQETAISLGTGIDNLLGEGTATVALLEQYCELVWNCSNAEQEEAVVLAEKLCVLAQKIGETFRGESEEPMRKNDTEENQKKEVPLLSISILVSNRIDTIEKCMESIKPLLDAVPSELIAIDTIGEETDGSIDVVRRYTDKIYRFEWCNDFATARNTGLSRANGEWFMFMDDDEWFEDVTEIIDFFRSGEYKKYHSATYRIRNYTTLDGSNWHMAVLGRMARRETTLTFVGTIHEALSDMKLPCKDFSAYVHHYGYAYASEEEKQAHIKRNVGLLKAELQKNPLDLRYRAQMAMELATYDNEGALAFCEETLQLCKKEKDSSYMQWMISLLFRLYEALEVEVAAAEQRYGFLKQEYGFTETTENAVCYQMVRICLIKEVPELAYPYAVRYFETRQFLEEHDEIRQLQRVADSGRYQTPETYVEMLHFGAYSAITAEAYEDAWNWYGQMPWEEESFQNEEALGLLWNLFQRNPKVKLLLAIVKRLMKNTAMMGRESVRMQVAQILEVLKQG